MQADEFKRICDYKSKKAKERVYELSKELPSKVKINKKNFFKRLFCKHLWVNHHYYFLYPMVPEFPIFEIKVRKECVNCGKKRSKIVGVE